MNDKTRYYNSSDKRRNLQSLPVVYIMFVLILPKVVVSLLLLLVPTTSLIARLLTTTTTTSITIHAFVIHGIPLLKHQQPHKMSNLYSSSSSTKSSPQRLDGNVDGVVYINDRCINCAACAGFAPQIFHRQQQQQDTTHVVYEQPQTWSDIVMTRAALAACPVAAIRIETSTTTTTVQQNHTNNNNNNNNNAARVVDEKRDRDRDDRGHGGWTEHDRWTVQQMTSKHMERPFPRPFLLNESESTNSSKILTTTTTTTAVPDVYWVGHHNAASFGAIPYLIKVRHNNSDVWVMIDTPKYNIQSVRDVISLTGPQGPHYLFMTHVDDTADHEKWANHFNRNDDDDDNTSLTTNDVKNGISSPQQEEQLYCQRIFHSGDLGPYNWIGDTSLEHVPILLRPPTTTGATSVTTNHNTYPNGLVAYTLDGSCIGDGTNTDWVQPFESGQLNTDAIILHTPGHSPGSCTLYLRRRRRRPQPQPQQRINANRENDVGTSDTTTTTTTNTTIPLLPGILFTGDTYGYTGTRMTGFPKYGHDMQQLNHTLSQLMTTLHGWDIIAPGHGHSRDYRTTTISDSMIRQQEMIEAQNDLFQFHHSR